MNFTAVVLFSALLITTASAFTIPSWDQLQSSPSPLHRPLQITPPILYDDALPNDLHLHELQSNSDNGLPILYRDKHCVDIASEIVWLAFEIKNINYITVLCNDADNVVPRVMWPDEEEVPSTSDPNEILEQIQTRYPDPTPFYPKISMAVDASRCNIMRLPGVMPRNSDDALMSSSPFLFLPNGKLVLKSSHCVSLEELEEMSEEYDDGPYICGKDLTAADIVWITYLERYAVQLPLLFPKVDVLNPRSGAYEMVRDWIKTMENNVSAYSCRVCGDARHWRRCLEASVTVHNARSDEKVTLPPVPKRERWWLKKYHSRNEQLWKEYCYDSDGERIRPWLGDTPRLEAGLYLVRHRDAIIQDFAVVDGIESESADEALRFVISHLVDMISDNDSEEVLVANAQKILEHVIDGIEIPRDLGMIPAVALGELLVTLKQSVESKSKVL